MKYIFHIIIIVVLFTISIIAGYQYPHRITNLGEFFNIHISKYATAKSYDIDMKICNNTGMKFQSISSNIGITQYNILEDKKCSEYYTIVHQKNSRYFQEPYIYIQAGEDDIRKNMQIKIDIENREENGKYIININKLLELSSSKYTKYGNIEYNITP